MRPLRSNQDSAYNGGKGGEDAGELIMSAMRSFIHISLIKYGLRKARMRAALVTLIVIAGLAVGSPVYADPGEQGSGPGAAGGKVPGEVVEAVQGKTFLQVVELNTPIYASPFDGMVGEPKRWTGFGFIFLSLLSPEPISFMGEKWYRVGQDEYVSARFLAPYTPSAFRGLAFSQPPPNPIGWVVYNTRVSKSPGAAPEPDAPLLTRYTAVNLYEEQQGGDWKWYRVGENSWLEQRRLGIVKPSPRPPEVQPGEKWIEVNLFEQTVAAYEGDRPVYATLASTGLPQWSTAPGLFRVWAKVKQDLMHGREGLPDYYYLEDVPWILYFNHDTALHGAYWHDGFGAPHSHGCVNLAPLDAKWLYEWATPVAGRGNWTLSTDANPGTWVWVHK